jgi:cytochrome c554/c'-like protein
MGVTGWQVLGMTSLLGLVAVAPLDAAAPKAIPDSSDREFLAQHWRRPIPPQGDPPEAFSALERSLQPEDCGTCHQVQFADWRTSTHSRSMGPGIEGQLVEMVKSDPASARSCPTCHAPLAEQAMETPGPDGWATNPILDSRLRRKGVVCAGCHVRAYQRFGPPRRDGTAPSLGTRLALPHNGFTASRAFLRSEFCASCHQFAPDGFALNGKLLENTFEEWRASPAARRGRQCQDCHMPDRRHLWLGVHDPALVKSGVTITLRTAGGRYRAGNRLRATLTVLNTGVGHHFPTYVTPKVMVRAELIDVSGQSLPGSIEERAIGREVPLDLSREIRDTRIPPRGRFTLRYRRVLPRSGLSLRVSVTVFPDYFYTRFFEAVLASGAGGGEESIREALDASRSSAFVIFRRELPLT